jgi:hypothetical protein
LRKQQHDTGPDDASQQRRLGETDGESLEMGSGPGIMQGLRDPAGRTSCGVLHLSLCD